MARFRRSVLVLFALPCVHRTWLHWQKWEPTSTKTPRFHRSAMYAKLDAEVEELKDPEAIRWTRDQGAASWIELFEHSDDLIEAAAKSEETRLRRLLSCRASAEGNLEPPLALLQSPVLRPAVRILLEVGAQGQVDRLIDCTLEQMEKGQVDWSQLCNCAPVLASHQREAHEAIRLLTLGNNMATEVTLSKGDGLSVEGLWALGTKGTIKGRLERSKDQGWGQWASFFLVEGPEELLGYRMVACKRSNGENIFNQKTGMPSFKAGDTLFFAAPDRAALLELATYDQLPEFSVELARLLKEGVEEKGRTQWIYFMNFMGLLPQPGSKPAWSVADFQHRLVLMTFNIWKMLSPSSPSKPSKREERKLIEQRHLECFLQAYNFRNVHRGRTFRNSLLVEHAEVVYPLHLAAAHGCPFLVRLLMKAGADAEQTTSSGRRAIDFAKENDRDGSHQEVIELLEVKMACLLTEGAAFQKLVRLDPSKLKVQSLDGIKLVVSTLGGVWGQSKTEHKYERFERAIYSTIQKSDETFASYVARHEVQYEDMLSLGGTLEEMRAYILLRNSGLDAEDKKRIIVDAKGTLEYTKITDALQLLGSRFFGEVQGTSKTGSRTKTYDVNFVDEPEEQAHVSEIEEFMTIPSEFSDDQAIEVFLAEGDEDALVMQQFEEALVETLQGDPDIAACLNTYVEARKKLQDKARSRGFWSSGKNFNKGKGRGKSKGGFGQFFGQRSRPPLAQRILNSNCKLCGQRGHWKAECPSRDRTDNSSKPSSSAFAGVTVVVPEDSEVLSDQSPTDLPPDDAVAFVMTTEDFRCGPKVLCSKGLKHRDHSHNPYRHKVNHLRPNQFAQLADQLQLLIKKDKGEEDSMTIAQVMELSFEELKLHTIDFGKTHVGRTYLDMLTEPKYLTWFSRSYKDSQNVKHVKFLRFLQLHVEHMEVAKASTTAKSAAKPKAQGKSKSYPMDPHHIPVEVLGPDGSPLTEDEEFPHWETVNMEEANHMEMQELKDRMANLESMLSQVEGRIRLYDRLLTKQPRHLWMSPRCRAWCRWSQFNMCKSPELAKKIMQDRQEDCVHLLLCDALFQFQEWRHPECHAHLEQPDGSQMVYQEELQAVLDQAFRAKCDMCAAGQLKNPITGDALKKSTQVLTTSKLMFDMLQHLRCSGNHRHGQIEGTIRDPKLGRINLSQYTELYTRQFAQRLARSMISSGRQHETSPENPDFACTASSSIPEDNEDPPKRRRLGDKQPPSEAYLQLYRKEKIQKVMEQAKAVAPRVGKIWLTSGPVIHALQDLFPDHQIVACELCKGADRRRAPQPSLRPEEAPFRITLGSHRNQEGNFIDNDWERWSKMSRRQLIRNCHPARLLVTVFGHNRVSLDVAKDPLEKVEHPITNDQEFDIALSQIVSAKNSLSRHRGYTPEILVLGKSRHVPACVSNETEEPTDWLDPTGADPEMQWFRDNLARRETARKAFITADHDQRLRRAYLRRSRPTREVHQPGDLVMYWRNGKGNQAGQWHGPGQVIIQEGSQVIWISHLSRLYRCAPEQVEHPITNDQEFDIALSQIVSAKNSLSRHKGYTPEILVLGKSRHVPACVSNETEEPTDWLDPTGADPEMQWFRDNLARRETARKAFITADHDQRLRRAYLRRSRPTREVHQPGDLVMYWRNGKGNQAGQWHGPGQVIIQEGSQVIWISHLSRLYRCAPEQVRPLSQRESDEAGVFQYQDLSHQIMPSTEIPDTTPQIENPNASNGSHTAETEEEQPDSEPGNHDLTSAVDVPIPSDNFSEDELAEEDNLFAQVFGHWTVEGQYVVRHHVELRNRMFCPTNVTDCPIDIADLTTDRETIVQPLHGEPWTINDHWNQVQSQRTLPLPWTGMSRFRIKTIEKPDVTRPQQKLDRSQGYEMILFMDYDEVTDCSRKNFEDQIAFLASAAKRQRAEVKEKTLTPEDKKLFLTAKQKEISSWLSTETVRKIARSQIPEEQILRSRWVLTWKPLDQTGQEGENNHQYKAKTRLVILGFEDPHIETLSRDAPTMGKDSRMLILQYAASAKWTLQSFDIQTAFLPGSRKDGRILGMEPPEEMRHQMKLKPWECCELLQSAYGLVNAPLLWYEELKSSLLQLGFIVSPLDPCVFVLPNKQDKTIHGIVGIHVDDGLAAGDDQFRHCINLLESKFSFGSKKESSFQFTGIRIQQKPDSSIELDQTKYIEDIPTIEVTRDRRKNAHLEVNHDERQSLRGLIGSLQYAASNTRPDISAKLSFLQAKITAAKVQDLLEANKLLQEAKLHKDTKIVIKSIPLADLRFVSFSDASFATRANSQSQKRCLLMATSKQIGQWQSSEASPLIWYSKKISRVVASTLASEAYAMSGAVDLLSWVCKHWSWLCCPHEQWKSPEVCLKGCPEAYSVVDCKSLYDLIEKTTIPSCQEYRTMLEALIIKDRIKEGIIVKWVHRAAQLADSLTKCMDNTVLRQFLAAGRCIIHDIDKILKVRADNRARKQWQQQQCS
eukprot:symbB.v1.2.022525.t1/scaffold1944.1/size145740/2